MQLFVANVRILKSAMAVVANEPKTADFRCQRAGQSWQEGPFPRSPLMGQPNMFDLSNAL